jgi:hypothetical protein
MEGLTLIPHLLAAVSTPVPTVAIVILAIRSATLLPRMCGYLRVVAFAARGRVANKEVLQLHCW